MEIIESVSNYIYSQTKEYVQQVIRKYSYEEIFNAFLLSIDHMDNDTFVCCMTFLEDIITHESLTDKIQRKEYLKALSKFNFIEKMISNYPILNTNKKNSFIAFLGRSGFKKKSKDLLNFLEIEGKVNPITCFTIINEFCWLNGSKKIFNFVDEMISHKSFVFRLMILNIFEHLKNVLTDKDKLKVLNLLRKMKNDEETLVISEVINLIDYYENDKYYTPSFVTISQKFQISGKSDFFELKDLESFARKILTNV